MASLTIRPGSRVRLKGQDDHVPDFVVVRCERDRCWIRQHDWAPNTEINVSFKQLFVPAEALTCSAPGPGRAGQGLGAIGHPR